MKTLLTYTILFLAIFYSQQEEFAAYVVFIVTTMILLSYLVATVIVVFVKRNSSALDKEHLLSIISFVAYLRNRKAYLKVIQKLMHICIAGTLVTYFPYPLLGYIYLTIIPILLYLDHIALTAKPEDFT